MAIIKCKMCGGDLEIQEGLTVAECEYCGSKQTLPNVDDEKKLNLFQRANRLRFGCEFDKAAGVYESIVADFPEEAEAYWGLVLCKYGIEYVDDPATSKKIPTCHRSSFDSVMDDVNFELVMEYADAVARSVYREEAKAIEELRKGIIEVSGKEEPYDIFICYKETDENGERTIDSVIAQDVYDALCEKGYRVFFSRITLEDKLGQEYEPYIFAALNSAKVMLAFGTSYDYYNAVWVKNEWSRFLQLMTQDKSKHLIPCYKDIDAYDMPKEFAHLQAQDMGKVGAIQDLLRGIEKLIGVKTEEHSKETVIREVIKEGGSTEDSLLKRAKLFLEDSDWKSADEYFDKVLDINPERAEAYLGKLMIELKLNEKQALIDVPTSYEDNKNYAKAYKFADGDLKDFFDMCHNERIYKNAVSLMKNDTETDYKKAIELFKNILAYKDSQTLFEQCNKNSEVLGEENQPKIEAGRAKLENLRNLQKNIFVEVRKIEQEKEKIKQENERLKQKQISEIRTKISALQAERSKLGLFAGSKKKDIDEKINALERSTRSIKVPDVNFGNVTEKLMHLWDPILDNKVLTFGSYSTTLGISKNGTVIGVYETDILGKNKYENDEAALEAYFNGENVSKPQPGPFVWKDIVSLATTSIGTHVIGLKSDGTVVVTGADENSQYDVSDWKNVVAISTDDGLAAALMSDGTVDITGDYYFEGRDEECLPASSYWRNMVAIYVSSDDIVGLRADGTVEISGNGYSNMEIEKGMCGAKREVLQWTDISTICNENFHIVGLKFDGTVVAAGENSDGRCNVSNWKDIIAISTDTSKTVGLRSDGTVVFAGEDKYGWYDVSDWKDIVAISVGSNDIVGLKSDGRVVTVGSLAANGLDISNWKDIIAISADTSNIFGFKADGTVLVAGYDKDNRLKNRLKGIRISKNRCDGICEGLIVESDEREKIDENTSAKGESSHISAQNYLSEKRIAIKSVEGMIAASANCSLCVQSNGIPLITKYIGGFNYGHTKIKGWSDIVAVAAGIYHSVGLKIDGTVVATNIEKKGPDHGQSHVDNWTDIVAISAQGNNTVGLSTQGTVVSCGDVNGIGDWKDIIAIATAPSYVLGLKNDGTVITTSSNIATDVNRWTDIVAISAEIGRAVGLRSDGTVVVTGEEDPIISNWTEIIAISSMGDTTLALKYDGTVKAVLNADKNLFDRGQCDVSEWHDIVAIAAGNEHSIGLMRDGTVVSTKYKKHPQFGSYKGQCDVNGWKLFDDFDTLKKRM